MLRYWPLKYMFSFPWSVFLSNCVRILITGCPLTSAKQRSKGEQKFIKAVQQDTWLVVPGVLPILAFLCFSFQVLASHPLPQSQCPEVHKSWRTIFIKKKQFEFQQLIIDDEKESQVNPTYDEGGEEHQQRFLHLSLSYSAPSTFWKHNRWDMLISQCQK